MKKICAFFCNHRNLGLLLSGASAAALAFAYTMEYVFNKLPCNLCYEQRKPYMVIIILGLLAAALAKKFPKVTFGLILLSVAALGYGTYTAGFHFGTEQHWWPLKEGCGGENVVPDPDMPLEDLIKYMQNRPIIRCDVPGWVFLGISMTGWNFLYSTGLILFTLFHAIKGYLDARKNKTQA